MKESQIYCKCVKYHYWHDWNLFPNFKLPLLFETRSEGVLLLAIIQWKYPAKAFERGQNKLMHHQDAYLMVSVHVRVFTRTAAFLCACMNQPILERCFVESAAVNQPIRVCLSPSTVFASSFHLCSSCHSSLHLITAMYPTLLQVYGFHYVQCNNF